MVEVIAMVKFNDRKALVIKEPLEFSYQRLGDLLIGIDKSETFLSIFYYQEPVGEWKAFGGREFDIPLDNGEVVHCDGQWWHGGSDKAEKLLHQEIVLVTLKDIQNLKDCYVFFGCYAFKGKWEQLAESYTGKLYEYQEYQEELRKQKNYEIMK